MERIIFFDGYCVLCDGFSEFVYKNDKKHQFKFASLHSKTAIIKLSAQDLSVDSLIYFENQKIFYRSQAVLRILFQLGGFYTLVSLIGSVLPLFIRDWVYNKVAKSRYKVFGKMDQCRLIPEADKAYFLD